MFKAKRDVNKNRIIFLYIPLLLCLAVEVFLGVSNTNRYKSPDVLSNIFNFLLIYLFYLLFMAIFKRVYIAVIISFSFFFIILVSNQAKIAYTTEPIYFKDIMFLNSPGTISGILDGSLFSILCSMWMGMLIFLIFAVVSGILAKKFDCRYNNIRKRIITIVSVIAVFVFLFLPINGINDLFTKAFFDVTYDKNNNTTSYVKYYNQHGLLAGMYGQYLTTKLRVPQGYNREEVEKMLDETEDTVKEKNFKKPNIVMVFSESFWDIDKQDSVKFDKPITKNYNELKDKGMYVDMISPTFGGISCNTEFEMLTGGTLTYYPECYTPYMDLYDAKGYENSPNIIKELKNNNYETNIVSSWNSDLFNCARVYDYFKVDKVKYRKDLKNVTKKGGRISDDYLADNIINTLKNKDKSKPLFHMTLTAEAHMPYKENKFKNYDINVKDSSLGKEETGIVKSYAQGIYDADKMLKKLYDYIKDFDEPTMLIFYGDHLPFLNTSKGKNVYDDIKYFNTGDSTLDIFRKYNTSCLILDNYNVEYEKKEYMSPYLVMPYVLNHMDIDISPYYKWLYNTTELYPANNFFVSIDSKGSIVPTKSISDDTTVEFSKKLAKMNWYMFVDKPKNSNID